jgi:hypothetical protein
LFKEIAFKDQERVGSVLSGQLVLVLKAILLRRPFSQNHGMEKGLLETAMH